MRKIASQLGYLGNGSRIPALRIPNVDGGTFQIGLVALGQRQIHVRGFADQSHVRGQDVGRKLP